MSGTVTRESFDSLTDCWNDPAQRLEWNSVFVLPAWLKAWWKVFGGDAELSLTGVKQGEKVIGIAPLTLKDGGACFLGSVDVCDYQDFVIAPGREEVFFNILLDDLKSRGVSHLELKALRPGSTVLTHLVPLAHKRNYEVVCQNEAVSLELDLPATWEEYLAMLSRKQRHEMKRKLRRLWGIANIEYQCLENVHDTGKYMDTFLKLFSMSQREKAGFMTPGMELYFRTLAQAMAKAGLLRFGAIEIDKVPISMIMVFDYKDRVYLYNSGYDPQYSSLSVGMLCKVLCLKESIEKGRKIWDFLKGGEPYKYQIGGQEIPLYRCRIEIR